MESPRLVLKIIGRRLIALRKAREMTQEQAAEHLGVDVRLLRRIEAGSIDVRVSRLCRLANRYGTPVRSLLEPIAADALRENVRRPEPPPGEGSRCRGAQSEGARSQAREMNR